MFLISDDCWEIHQTRNTGRGIFAKKIIEGGTVIGDYIGEVVDIAEYDVEKDKKGLYLMYYTDRAGIYPDLSKPGIHLLNHSCNPNCWIYTYRGHTLFFALRAIKPDEELTISYLLSPKDETCDPCTHDCRCESVRCTGTMHLTHDKYEKWQKFQEDARRKTKVAPFVFGKNLPKLKFYPTAISLDPIYAEMR